MILTLTSGKSTNHEETAKESNVKIRCKPPSREHNVPSTKTSEETLRTELAAHLDQTASSGLPGESLGLVDLGEQGVGGLGDDSGGETSNQTGAQVECRCFTGCEQVLGLAVCDGQLFLYTSNKMKGVC